MLCTVMFVMLLSSCKKQEIKIPKGILTRRELVPVLVDMHLAQAAGNLSQLNDSVRSSYYDYSLSVFRMHQITKEKYDSSMAFYAAYPGLLDEIYQEVINELSKKQGEVSAK
jgi:hypothetical protein